MKFCSQCGASVSLRIPEGDNLPRYICNQCNEIHYQNPKIVAGCIAEWKGKILLCRRAIEPRYGLWTLPAGFMENGETSLQGAAREAMEEANAVVTGMSLYSLFSLPHINQVYVMFRGIVSDGRAFAGPESLDVGWFTLEQIPWNEMAFPVIEETLRLYLEDREKGQFRIHAGDVIRKSDRSVEITRY
jgi:ADP-ribose pyrophosphatase YjhB (NUDIX family)